MNSIFSCEETWKGSGKSSKGTRTIGLAALPRSQEQSRISEAERGQRFGQGKGKDVKGKGGAAEFGFMDLFLSVFEGI